MFLPTFSTLIFPERFRSKRLSLDPKKSRYKHTITMTTGKTISAGQWYQVINVEDIDSPALLLYRERVKENIRLLKSMVKHVGALRPHVKTNKMPEVCELMLNEGISKFKCATIAEAEMLARINAPDVLLAYQPVGPKVSRLLRLIKTYPSTHFSCLVDNKENAAFIARNAVAAGITLDVYIDLNVGMNRTGIRPADALPLVEYLQSLPGIQLAGLHGYDGHIRDTDLSVRQQRSDDGFNEVLSLSEKVYSLFKLPLKIVVGGTPTFPTHASRENVECSPGTFVFSDWTYKHIVPDEPFEYGASQELFLSLMNTRFVPISAINLLRRKTLFPVFIF